MSGERETFQGDGQAFADVVLSFAKQHGRLFCNYTSEADKVTDAKLDIKSIYKHHDFLVVLREAQRNLSFPKTVVKAGLYIVTKQCKEEFGLKEGQVDDYVSTTTKRIRCLGRVVSQGELKSQGTQWVEDLPWRQAAAATTTGEVQAKGKPRHRKVASTTPKEYIYEFNDELVVATRCPLAGGPKEPSLPLSVPEGANDSDFAKGTWLSGETHEVPGLTIGRLKEFLHRGPGSSSAGELWSATHCVTKHKVTIRQRVDRGLLLSIYEQQRQIVQVKMTMFGPVANEHEQLPKGDSTLTAAMQVMTVLADKFVKDELKKGELKEARDAALKGLDLKAKRPTMKRPAAALASECEEATETEEKEEVPTKPDQEHDAKTKGAPNKKEKKEEAPNKTKEAPKKKEKASSSSSTMAPIPASRFSSLYSASLFFASRAM